MAGKLKEPCATLVLFLAAGLRIGESLAIKWTDFKDNVLHITHRIYEGDVDAVKSKRSDRKLPIDPILMEPIEKLGKASQMDHAPVLLVPLTWRQSRCTA